MMQKTNNRELKHIYNASLFNINDLDILLHETLKQTRDLLNAEAGSIYIKENNELAFNVFQNDTFSYEDVYKQFYTLKDIRLPITDDEKYLAVESLRTKKIIIIDDVYRAEDYDFMGVKEFDKKFNYKTHSIITAPLIHPISNDSVGVVQILNKNINGKYLVFDEKDKSLLSMFCSFVALSISKAQKDVVKLKKLNDKLKETNINLEQRIKKEIEENEKKSVIIYNQSKMVSMGEMIGNIAHQWRQPLSTISTIASGLNLNLQFKDIDKKEISINMQQIVRTTKHLSQTIDDFREFYKITKHKVKFDVESTINSCISIVDASLSTNCIKTIFKCDSNIKIYNLKNEFTQAIINLLSNAKDALCEKVSIDEDRFIFIDLYTKNKQIIISIKDNAGGINDDIINKIFEQHFTTKEKEGNGIGLFMSKQIIHEHMNGQLEVENENFKYQDKDYVGAKFTIVLN